MLHYHKVTAKQVCGRHPSVTGMSKPQGFRPTLTIVTFILISVTAPIETGQTESLFFVHSQPNTDLPNKRPFPTIILLYNESENTLEPVWSVRENIRTLDVRVYPNAGVLIISEGGWLPVKKLRIIPMDNIKHSKIIDLEKLGLVIRYYYFEEQESLGEIVVHYKEKSNKTEINHSFKFVRIPIDNSGEAKDLDTLFSVTQLRDMLSIRMEQDGTLESIGFNVSFDCPPVPDSIVIMKSSNGWVLLANDPYFHVLMSVPDHHGLTQRELLIYNRKANFWNSTLTEGSQTTPKLINGWLVGVIADTDPETNYETHKGFPPILREDVVFIEPLKDHQFTVHLGKGCEVLWIENSEVYYRVGQDLYKAKIENDDFTNRQLILSDPKVNHIHWAFRGSEGKQ